LRAKPPHPDPLPAGRAREDCVALNASHYTPMYWWITLSSARNSDARA